MCGRLCLLDWHFLAVHLLDLAVLMMYTENYGLYHPIYQVFEDWVLKGGPK
jgi:hypothetical protein